MSSHIHRGANVWLSHELNTRTPAYRGGRGFAIAHDKKMTDGHHCNSSSIALDSHLGSHVDVPFHFIKTGKRVCDYQPSEWIFNKCGAIELMVEPDDIINLPKIKPAIEVYDDLDFLIIKTGFERYRDNTVYWQHSPAYCSSIACYLKEKFPSLAAIGFDSISLTGYQHRELGRKAHQAFLSLDIRIFEDLHLQCITSNVHIMQIIALPLRYDEADGAPCTIVATLEA